MSDKNEKVLAKPEEAPTKPTEQQPKKKNGKKIAIWTVVILVLLTVGGYFAAKYVWNWMNLVHITDIEIISDFEPTETFELERNIDSSTLQYKLYAEKNCVKYPRIAKYCDEPTEEEIANAAAQVGEIFWVSSDPSILSVTDDGVVTGIGKGDATISVCLGKKDAASSDTESNEIAESVVESEAADSAVDSVADSAADSDVAESAESDESDESAPAESVADESSSEAVTSEDASSESASSDAADSEAAESETADSEEVSADSEAVSSETAETAEPETEENILFSDSRNYHVKVTPTGFTATESLKFKKYKEQLQIECVSNPEDADNVHYTYASSNEKVATVDENGLVTAVKAGQCVITTTMDGYEFTAETSVSVPEPPLVYPLSYSDGGVTINVYKEKFAGSWVYAAHVQMSDYSRMGTDCANGKYGAGSETTSHAARRLGAILTINGDWAAPRLNYPVVRSGVLCNNKGALWCPAVYSRNSGMLINAWETGGTPGYAGADMASLVSSGAVTDTFSFGPPMLVGGGVVAGSAGGRAQRTFIGSSGAAGDIWLCVSDGRHNDGVSPGLTYGECAQYLQSKGCTFGVPLDGGGSSTMVWKGRVLNAERGNERAIVDFVYVR